MLRKTLIALAGAIAIGAVAITPNLASAGGHGGHGGGHGGHGGHAFHGRGGGGGWGNGYSSYGSWAYFGLNCTRRHRCWTRY
jgi:hypothetical protein